MAKINKSYSNHIDDLRVRIKRFVIYVYVIDLIHYCRAFSHRTHFHHNYWCQYFHYKALNSSAAPCRLRIVQEKPKRNILSSWIFFPLLDTHTSLNEINERPTKESRNWDLLRGSPVGREQDSLAVLGIPTSYPPAPKMAQRNYSNSSCSKHNPIG